MMRLRQIDRERALGVCLYAVTLGSDALVSGFPRFFLIYVLAVTSGVTLGLPEDSFTLALIATLAPIGYSLMGVIYPLRGRLWRWRLGAREPSVGEREQIHAAATALQAASDGELPTFECYVIDEVWPLAMTRGRAVIVSRGLVQSDSLAAILAHELGHVHSLDGRLTEGLERMRLWDDPLREGTSAAESAGVDRDSGRFVFGVMRWLIRLAGGGDVVRWFRRPWAWYWRHREFVADAYAASLGQGHQLLTYLEEVELPLDGPQRGVVRGQFEHPYVIERTDRLRRILTE